MWPVTKENADFVIVMSASTMACAVGAYVAHILTKNYMTTKYENIIEVEVNTAKAYFSKRNKTGEYADPVALAENVLHDDYEKVVERYSGVEVEAVEEDPAPLKPRPKPKPVSKPEPEEDMETFEQRLIDEAKEEVQEVKDKIGVFDVEEFEEDDEEDAVTVNIFESEGSSSVGQNKRGSGRPYIISFQEFDAGEFEYMQNTLTYFDGDGVLVDERENPINHMNKIIGESNLDFGNASEDKNVVYIRNDEMEVDFEVCRSPGKFTEEVLGMPDRVAKTKVKKFRTYD